MGRVRCHICGEKIPPEDLDSFRGDPLCLEHAKEIAMEIERMREIHKSGIVAKLTEEEIHNWAETFKETLRKPIERLDIDPKETNLAFEAMSRIDKAIKSLELGIIFDKIDPSTLRLLYLKLDELECCASRSKKPIVGALANQAKARLR